MAIEQTLLTSGKRVARLLIKDLEQVKLWQLFKELGQLERLEQDVFVPKNETLRHHVAVLEDVGEQGLSLMKRLWATGRVGLSKLWVGLRGKEKGLEQAFYKVEKIKLPEKPSINNTVEAFKTQVKKAPENLPATIPNIHTLYHPDNIFETGKKQHELGHTVLAYLGNHEIRSIVMEPATAQTLAKCAAEAAVEIADRGIHNRQDLIQEILVALGGEASISRQFKKSLEAANLFEQKAYQQVHADLFWGAQHDYHQIQQLLLKHQHYLTPAERDALKTLNIPRLKFDSDLKKLSTAEWSQLDDDFHTLTQHPLVGIVRNYAASILDSIPTERFNKLTAASQTMQGNKAIRGFLEEHLNRENLQKLKSHFLDSLLSEDPGNEVYKQLAKK